HITQWQVGGGERHTQLASGKHHYYARHASFSSKEFGVAGKARIGAVADHVLGYRCGDHRREAAIEATVCGVAQHGKRTGGAGGIGLARRYAGAGGAMQHGKLSVAARWITGLPRNQGNVTAKQGGALLQYLEVAEHNQRCAGKGLRELQDQVGTDARRVTTGDGDGRGVLRVGYRHKPPSGFPAASSAALRRNGVGATPGAPSGDGILRSCRRRVFRRRAGNASRTRFRKWVT